ncbi:MAG TPA: Gfo/Idh/MocA family oxidoreductase [Planctomycetota bacterium]|nr:Gfo/Idh/MocA family oxidoreductase [Planctomycetota bacterium]
MGHCGGATRRGFLAALGAALPAPYFLTSGALGAEGKAPASDRIQAGVIGTGGRGMALLGMNRYPRCTVVAVCDVYAPHAARAQKAIGGSCDAVRDFRQILDRADIDAVATGTPDHWHALITVMACQSGKDVYCEKPLCRTIADGQAMVAAARRYSRVVQMGSQYRSMAHMRQFCEWMRNGRFGRIETVRLSHERNWGAKVAPPVPPPADLDWDLWLGPAPWAPYHPSRCLFNFRFWMDYAGGFITDNGTHMMGVVSWAMGADETGPVAIEATASHNPESMYDVPVELRVRCEFENPKFILTWEQPGDGKLNMQFIGPQATVDGFFRPTLVKGEADLSPTRGSELHLYESNDHFGNWLECVQTRKRPVYDVEIGYRVTSWSLLGNIAWLVGRKLRWDPVAQCFPDDAEANRFLQRPYREPWRL